MRLRLVPAREIDDYQKPVYEAFTKDIQERFGGIVTSTGDGALLGPWGVWVLVPSVGGPMLDLIKSIRALPGLSVKSLQVAILVTGAKFGAAYEMYAHAAAAKDAGLSDTQIVTILAGGRPHDLGDAEGLTADFTSALLRGGPLPEPLYAAALNRIGQDGVDALIFTVAQYSFISMMLNAYDVHVPTVADDSVSRPRGHADHTEPTIAPPELGRSSPPAGD
jgi:4-carboxymuconolactone decarboxylase